MDADRERSGRRTPGRALAYAACGVVLLAGCASMPDSGDLRGVDSTPRQDTPVRVFAMPPQEDAEPTDIVQGFLEALTSDDPHYETARRYLTPAAQKKWQPGVSTTVLDDGPGADIVRPADREQADGTWFTLIGTKVAVVDAQQSYTPTSGEYRETVHLVQDKKTKQWRIDTPPQGVVMGRSDFQRNYVSVNKYYFASDTKAPTAPQTVAVADPVYVRERVDPVTQVVRSLLSGPTSWLDPVVRTSFPTGTTLQKGASSLTPDDRGALTVPLNDKAAHVSPDRCQAMAGQLLFTLQNLTPAVETVDLQAGRKMLCTVGMNDANGVATRGSVVKPQYLYFVNGAHRLVRTPAVPEEGGTKAKPLAVPGALGDGDKDLRSVAVSRDEHMAAGVGLDGKSLYVGSLVSGGSLGDPVLISGGKTADAPLTTPSWDIEGDLWVADRNPADPRLLLFKEGAGKPLTVETPGLDGRIKDVRVAADGVRIALVVEKGGKQSLFVGRIEREGRTGDARSVSVRGLRSTTPELEEVTTMSWAGDSRLVVVGREQGGVQQTRYVQVDGSTPEGPPPAALTGVKEIAASEDDEMPLVAYSEDGIVRLPSGAQWQKVDADGTAPVYPG
ncbi:LpqB family beta-propeller domain-containing protein [Streptomyces griseorubiginosus]|uniref:LpqB family beta-propeller domain-containing protein n=1 Tax=Streptomyces griseorubiginosus TaxID=67304 RepID=UPI002E80476F|nr:LpqB family beta-propeller domain-containing protein [Streptomyces griseorubiginosus]WUB46641.1 LpqB family beta-propeller domain-containing protein [Streptomyces griseorubiginosus]WUB55162.1 LpqB family beta-propeller domain-containing protein [Streptomyces griseorubiginosus]